MIALHLIGIVIGVLMVLIAVFNWDIWFYDAESQVIEMIGGEDMVRWYWGGSGVVLIVLTVVDWISGWPVGRFL